MISIFLSLLRLFPRFDLSQKMFSTQLRRKYTPLLSDGISYKYQLSLSGLVCHLRIVFLYYFLSGWSTHWCSGVLNPFISVSGVLVPHFVYSLQLPFSHKYPDWQLLVICDKMLTRCHDYCKVFWKTLVTPKVLDFFSQGKQHCGCLPSSYKVQSDQWKNQTKCLVWFQTWCTIDTKYLNICDNKKIKLNCTIKMILQNKQTDLILLCSALLHLTEIVNLSFLQIEGLH